MDPVYIGNQSIIESGPLRGYYAASHDLLNLALQTCSPASPASQLVAFGTSPAPSPHIIFLCSPFSAASPLRSCRAWRLPHAKTAFLCMTDPPPPPSPPRVAVHLNTGAMRSCMSRLGECCRVTSCGAVRSSVPSASQIQCTIVESQSQVRALPRFRKPSVKGRCPVYVPALPPAPPPLLTLLWPFLSHVPHIAALKFCSGLPLYFLPLPVIITQASPRAAVLLSTPPPFLGRHLACLLLYCTP